MRRPGAHAAGLGLALLFLAPCGAEPQTAGRVPPLPSDLLEDERNTIEVFRRASNSVVFVTNTQLRRDFFSLNVLKVPRGTGSGFVWDRDGHVVTNFHVLRGGDAFSVTLSDGSAHEARVVGYEERKDLAVLKIDAPPSVLTPVEAGDSSALVVGQKVLAIGNPFGLDQTLTTGVISALGREIQTDLGSVIEDVIQTDAEINPGNSGGPLLDSGGRLIGVNTAIYSPTGASAGIGFAVPMATVALIVPQLIQHGKVKRAGIGITVVPDALARRWGVAGVVIRQVGPGSAAEGAGLQSLRVGAAGRVRSFDLIVGIDESEIGNFNDLAIALEKHEPGDRVTLRYRRGQQESEVEVTLQEI